MEKLRFALIGYGSFGRSLVKFLFGITRAELVAVYDDNESFLHDAARDLGRDLGGDLKTFTSLEKLMDWSGFDAVMICSANYQHRDQAILAAQGGKHVFCEKPMAINTSDCWDMVEASEKNDVKLMVGHKRRLRPPWAKMAAIAKSGELGDPLAVNVTQYHWYPEFPEWWLKKDLCGGIYHRAGVHDIDFMRFVLGDAESVFSAGISDVTGDAEYRELMTSTIQFRGCGIGTIQCSFHTPPLKFREAYGPTISCSAGGIRMIPHLDHIDLEYQRLGGEKKEIRFDDLGADHAYNLELSNFVEWVLDGAEPLLTWEEGLRCVEIMEAAYIGADKGGKKIDLPLCPEREG